MPSVTRDQREQEPKPLTFPNSAHWLVGVSWNGSLPLHSRNLPAPKKCLRWTSVHNHLFPHKQELIPALCLAGKLQMLLLLIVVHYGGRRILKISSCPFLTCPLDVTPPPSDHLKAVLNSLVTILHPKVWLFLVFSPFLHYTLCPESRNCFPYLVKS